VPIDDLRDALAANRQQALDVASTTGRRQLLKVLRRSEQELAARLHQADGLRGRGGETFTHARMRASLEQVRHVVSGLQEDLRAVLNDQVPKVASGAADASLAYLRAAERAYEGVGADVLPLREAMMLDAAAQGAKASLLRRLGTEGDPGVLARYGDATVAEFERVLQQGVAQRKPTSEVRDELVEASPFLQGAPASWAERIVRTELHGASNRAAHETHVQANDLLGDVVRIVSATFDNRTSWDSYNVHGEVRRTNEAFEYVTAKGEHQLFLTPPNRPNDREVVLAHRLSWPVPKALLPKGTGEVQRRCQAEGVKFPGRPRVMSTVGKMPVHEGAKAVQVQVPEQLERGRLGLDENFRGVTDPSGKAAEVVAGVEHPGLAKWLGDAPNQPELVVKSDWPGKKEGYQGMYQPQRRGGPTPEVFVDPEAKLSYFDSIAARRGKPALGWGDTWRVGDRLGQLAGLEVFPKEGLDAAMAAENAELVRNNFAHELGHHVAMKVESWEDAEVRGIVEPAYKRLLLTNDARARIKRGELKSPAISRYAATNEDEYFAESFNAYVRDPAALRRHDENGYAMVKQVLERLRIE
jgi:hypothetical protein